MVRTHFLLIILCFLRWLTRLIVRFVWAGKTELITKKLLDYYVGD